VKLMSDEKKMTPWIRLMLEEIEQKAAESREASAEESLRSEAGTGQPPPAEVRSRTRKS